MTFPVNKLPPLTRLFFHKMDLELLERLRTDILQDERRSALLHALGKDDPQLVEQLLKQGVSVETLDALRLVPLVMVAWSDNILHEEERQRILEVAAEGGLTEDSPGCEMLRTWLSDEPPAELFDAWKDYVRTLCHGLAPKQVNALRDRVLGEAHEVARAAGGPIGLGSVDHDESAVLRELQSAFPNPQNGD